MGKKRKAETSGMEEVEKGLYSSFCAAANSISQLYTQAQNQQRLSFAAGQRHAMDQVYQWVLRQRDAGATQLSSDQLLNFLQRELDTGDIAVSHFSQQAAAATAPAPAPAASPPQQRPSRTIPGSCRPSRPRPAANHLCSSQTLGGGTLSPP
eukprot:TRINITY_DN473_c0_g1_i1.p1 TRINITY_DN473_c0_g1~~TRINITY_DN473_c0_g1_i1.p1  ORF type:complete len:152 (-),score=21.82 TRINITY_DN473_c0_g1_i1:968-1423(-)